MICNPRFENKTRATIYLLFDDIDLNLFERIEDTKYSLNILFIRR